MSVHGSEEALAHLNEVHRSQVRDFLTLFRHKLDRQTKEVDGTFKDCKDMRYTIPHGIYPSYVTSVMVVMVCGCSFTGY
jgi:ABC-type Zn2+ transport system substrate-binding protein/surface adhesin